MLAPLLHRTGWIKIVLGWTTLALLSCGGNQPAPSQSPALPVQPPPIAAVVTPWVPMRNVSLDGEKLLVSREDAIDVVAWKTQTPIRSLSVPNPPEIDSIWFPMWSPGDQEVLAIIGDRILVWKATGELFRTISHPNKATFSFAVFSPDGNSIAAGDSLGGLFVHAWREKIETRWSLPVDPSAKSEARHMVRSISYSPQGNQLLVTRDHETTPATVYQADTGQALDPVPSPPGLGGIVFAQWAPSGDTFAATFWSGSVGIYHYKKKQWLWVRNISPGQTFYGASYSPTGDKLFLGRHNPVVVSSATGDILFEDRSTLTHLDNLFLPIPTLDGKTIALVELYSQRSSTALFSLEQRAMTPYGLFFPAPATIQDAALSQDGQFLFVLTSHGSIFKHDLQKRQHTVLLPPNRDQLASLVLHDSSKQHHLWVFPSYSQGSFLELDLLETTPPPQTRTVKEIGAINISYKPDAWGNQGLCFSQYYKDRTTRGFSIVRMGEEKPSTLDLPTAGESVFWQSILSPDCRQIAILSHPIGQGEERLELFNIEHAAPAGTTPTPQGTLTSGKGSPLVAGHPLHSFNTQFSPDGKRLYTVLGGKKLWSWTTQPWKAQKPLQLIRSPKQVVQRLAVGNKQLAYVLREEIKRSYRFSVQLRPFGKDRTLSAQGLDPKDVIHKIGFSADGNRLFVSTKTRVLIIDTSSGKPTFEASVNPTPTTTAPPSTP